MLPAEGDDDSTTTLGEDALSLMDMDDDSLLPLEELRPGDLPVHVLRCRVCDQVLCRRGMDVVLLADSTTHLFSTDFLTAGVVSSGQPRRFEMCECRVVDLLCVSCVGSTRPNSRTSARRMSSPVGYHVIEPCASCLEDSHNSHYVLFHSNAVAASPWPTDGTVRAGDPRQLTWEGIRAFDGTHTPIVLAAECPPDLTCPICLGVLRDAVRTPCGHRFCQSCLVRCVDNSRCCPMDRRPVSQEDISPDADARLAVGRLLVHCRFGCTWPGSARVGRPVTRSQRAHCHCRDWELGRAPDSWIRAPDGSGCPAVVRLAFARQHERRCGFRCDCVSARCIPSPSPRSQAPQGQTAAGPVCHP